MGRDPLQAVMEPIRKIDNELAIAAQVTLEQFPQLVRDGFKSILNLRSPDELGFLSDERERVESIGLYYINLPLKVELITPDIIAPILKQIRAIPKPLLLHCDTAMRAAAMALIYIATRQGITLDDAFIQAQQMNLFEIPVYRTQK